MKQRNPLLVLPLIILTGGLYSLYWLGKVAHELRTTGSRSAPSPWWLLTFPLILPIYIYLFWMHQAVRERTSGTNPPSDLIALILFLFFVPGLLAYWQEYLNETISSRNTTQGNYCETCGEPLDTNAQYCPNCGSPV